MTNSKRISVFLFTIISFLSLKAQEDQVFQIRTVAFYNLENLFDTENDPYTYDDDRTPQGKDNWTEENYKDKLSKLAYAISRIGYNQTGTTPAILGVCEIENRQVLEDLIQQPALANSGYDIIHYDSPDRRGIDVALLYKRNNFLPLHSQARVLKLFESGETGKRIFTRDQLVVSGLFEGEEMHVVVHHWPSRSGGEAGSSYKREAAAALNKKIIDSLYRKDPYAKIINMGDFNDDPGNKSLKEILGAKAKKEKVGWQQLYNPMAQLRKQGIGSLAYRDSWNLFDQILVSQTLLGPDYSTYSFFRAGVFNESFLITPLGKYKGYPFRSFGEEGYTGGYSDHFPVYIYLIKRSSN